MTDEDLRALPIHRSDVFDRAAFDAMMEACIPAKTTERIRAWRKKAHLPLVLVTRGRA